MNSLHEKSGKRLSIRREPLMSSVAQTLIGELNAELTLRYPEDGDAYFRLDEDEVAPGRGVFLVASVGGTPVGCGAFRGLNARTAEVKRMYVAPPARGRGIGGRLVSELEGNARTMGFQRLILETGIRQPEALALYERAGFARMAPFGEYVDSPRSVCMAKDLFPQGSLRPGHSHGR